MDVTGVIGLEFVPAASPSMAYTGGVSEMIAVVETEEFLTDVKGVLSEDEHDDLILYVALHPEAGDVIPETGGCGSCGGQQKGGANEADRASFTTFKIGRASCRER